MGYYPLRNKEGKLESFVSTSKDVTYQVKTKKRLKNLAMVDTLTKVLNRLLKNISKLLGKNIRKIDKLGRWGGEEFIIILHETSKKKTEKKAEELRKMIEKNTIDEKYKITASIGVTSFKDEDTKSSLFARVDDALYRAKEKGRNCVVAL